MREKLWGDDSSYIAHAFTIALDGDLDYSNENVIRWNERKNMAGHSIGSGAMAAAFVFPFSLIDRITGHPVIQNHANYYGSWSFFGFMVGVNVYFLLSIYLFWKAFKLLWPAFNSIWLLALVVLSSGVPFYVLMRFTMSHGFELFAGSLALYSAVRLFLEIRKGNQFPLRWHLLCGISLSMGLFIRYFSYNLIFFSPLVLLVLFTLDTSLSDRRTSRRFYVNFFILLLFLIISLLPNAVFLNHYFGSPMPSSSAVYGLDANTVSSNTSLTIICAVIKRLPKVFLILFSSEWGLLYTNPILLLGAVALVVSLIGAQIKKISITGLAAILAIFLFYGFNFSIILWSQHDGMGYGYRHLLPTFSMSMLGLLLFLRNLQKKGKMRLIRNLSSVIIIACVCSVLFMMCYGVRAGLWSKRQVNIFNVMQPSSGKGYITNCCKRIIDPETWTTMVKKRFIGMMPRKVFYELTKCHDKDIRDAYMPASVFMQSLVLFAVWILFAIWFDSIPKRRMIGDGSELNKCCQDDLELPV
jgi:hypothetical protein